MRCCGARWVEPRPPIGDDWAQSLGPGLVGLQSVTQEVTVMTWFPTFSCCVQRGVWVPASSPPVGYYSPALNSFLPFFLPWTCSSMCRKLLATT